MKYSKPKILPYSWFYRFSIHNRLPVIKILILSVLILLYGCGGKKLKWEYQPYSSGVIQFEFYNDPPSTYFINADGRTIIPDSWFNTDILEITKKGIYYLNFEIDRPSAIETHIAEDNYQVFVFPGDTAKLLLKFNGEGYQLEFHGNAKNINSFLAYRKLNDGLLDTRQQFTLLRYTNAKYEDFVRKTDSLALTEYQYLDEHQKEFNLSDDFINFKKADIFYTGMISKLEVGQWNGRYNRIGQFIRDYLPPPDLYYKFLDEAILDDGMAIYSLNYVRYLDAYFDHNNKRELGKDDTYNVSYHQRTIDRIEESNEALSGKSGEVYGLYKFSRLISYYLDSSRIDSLAHVYEIDGYPILFKHAGSEVQEKSITKGEIIPEFYASNTRYDLLSIRDFKESHLFIRFCHEMPDSTDIGGMIFNKIKDNFSKYEDLKFLTIYMDMPSELWKESMSDVLPETNNLLVEGSWNFELRDMFEIHELPHYIFLRKNNIFIKDYDGISLAIQGELDSLVVKNEILL